MRRVPPWPVRRLLVAPLVVLLDVVLIALSPLALLAAPLLGSRPLRLAVILAAYAARHLQAVVSLLGLWLRGRARDVDAHYAVMHRFVDGVYRVIVRAARVRVVVDETDAAHRALATLDRPIVLLSRHAGEGDTLLVVHELLCRHGRRPSVVMHEALRWDPLIDVLGTRQPHRFVDPRGGDTEREIAALARDLGPDGALIIFPEGANFSEAGRRRGIERLIDRGFHREAEIAGAMRHVAAPRPGGALAALEARPDADVVIMGHVGFPHGMGDMWRLLPKPQTIEVGLWHEPAGAVPAAEDERIAWLFARWRRLDEWVQERLGSAV